ncbi:MAG: transketolase C-terminal domain-containing protein [Nitrososphaeria archaeon]
MQSVLKVTWKRLPLSTNYAIAQAVKDADVDVVSAYPITPQTTVVERISELIANGELKAEMIHVESEHSAMSAAIGASAAGARAFTATSAQGLELMHELLHIASGMRLPIVMSVAARALSAPISIWGDYSDVMNTRDTSWVTLIASSAQEAYDSIIQAYRIAEDPRVFLPVMVAYDGFAMSHTYEPVLVSETSDAFKDYIPKEPKWYTLNPDRPITMGSLANPDWYYEFKYQQVVAIKNAYSVVMEADHEYGKRYERSYGIIEEAWTDDSDIVLLTYGGLYGTMKESVEQLRKDGIKVGIARLRLFRPFPVQDITKLAEKVKAIAVLDRAITYGMSIAGPVAREIISSVYSEGLNTSVYSFIVGIGQRTVTEKDIQEIYYKARSMMDAGERQKESIYWGVRE